MALKSIAKFGGLGDPNKQSTETETNGVRPIPARTQTWINGEVSEGSRNNEGFAAAAQLRDAKYTYDEAVELIIEGGDKCGLRRRECISIVRSAYRGTRREPIVRGCSGG